MRKFVTAIIAVSICFGVVAQAPQKLKYQAVIRNDNHVPVDSGTIAIRLAILQASPDGPVVYTETQKPTTCAGGLITIEIGGEAGFDTIDWGKGPYFLRTEVDPAGGTEYSITGTSQLLSVPYALHANTAGSTDGSSGHYIGELYGGGVIYYLDKSGQHGLIVSPEDISNNCVWSNLITGIGPPAKSSWDGKSNSLAILAQEGHTNSAALLCINYRGGGFSDWYLPAIDELIKMFNVRYEINKSLGEKGIKLDYYYSSTEVTGNGALASLAAGTVNESMKNYGRYVRAIRAF
ncbi:MAG: hypothetical protein U0T82_13835 [Bacteroidales bacterium]